MSAQFIGVGVGPGDPELITLKAARYIEQADVISYIVNEQGESQARHIARCLLQGASATHYRDDIPVLMPMNEDRTVANKVYDKAAATIVAAVTAGKQVVFLCEGDPLFFGSFAYLLERLQSRVSCEVVPGISSVHAASSALQLPLSLLKESFAVVSGRHSTEKLEATLQQYESVVIMKAGRSRQRILDALHATRRSQDACYLEYIGRDDERIYRDINQLEGAEGPYFSLFFVTKQQRVTKQQGATKQPITIKQQRDRS